MVESVDFANFSSSVVTGTEMSVVWAWIPERFALFSPIRLYNVMKHERSLTSWVTIVDPRDIKCCLFLFLFFLLALLSSPKLDMCFVARPRHLQCSIDPCVFTINMFSVRVTVVWLTGSWWLWLLLLHSMFFCYLNDRTKGEKIKHTCLKWNSNR